ncbi:hypothetical protein RCS94_07690 [Orbaceae bacterium ac157xtp]
MIAPSSYGALSATSANTIKGNAPWFTGQSGAKKLGFKIGNGNTTYSESEGNLSSTPSVINYFDAGLTLNDFKVTNLTASDFSLTTDYYDADGDASYSTKADTFSMGSVTYDWYENGKDPENDAPISVTGQTLGCGSGLSLPLTLKITLPNVKVKSRYGNPNESSEMNLVQMYKIGSASGICFAKPNQMIACPGNTWAGTSGPILYMNNASYKDRNQYGGGYDSTQFDPVNGFKANLTTKFPTTGFPKASFNLIMTSNASDYTFTSNAEPAVTVDTTGKVTLNSKPSGPVTIKARFNGTLQVHEYTFDPREVWVVPKSGGSRNYASAISACGVESKIPTRVHLTNSPYNMGSAGVSSIPNNIYTRAVGGGVVSE